MFTVKAYEMDPVYPSVAVVRRAQCEYLENAKTTAKVFHRLGYWITITDEDTQEVLNNWPPHKEIKDEPVNRPIY